jgi:GNAT superfamily N-acetyltransferase
MKDSEHVVSIDGSVTPEEVVFVREEDATKLALWKLCLAQSLALATARERETGKLVGIGFLIGNQRRGEITDLVVHPSARGSGLGGRILDTLVRHAKQLEIIYLGLTYDKRTPWLKDFYCRHGFRLIDFAMWEAGSLPD